MATWKIKAVELSL